MIIKVRSLTGRIQPVLRPIRIIPNLHLPKKSIAVESDALTTGSSCKSTKTAKT